MYSTSLAWDLNAQRFDEFFETLKVFFANIPNNITIDNEKYYQSLLFAIFKLVGLSVEVEVNSNVGRMDCVIKLDDTICIIEFKLNGTKEQALQQIHDNQYPQMYQMDGKRLLLIGVEFDKTGRNIAGFVMDEL